MSRKVIPKLQIHNKFDDTTHLVTEGLTREDIQQIKNENDGKIIINTSIPIDEDTITEDQEWEFEVIKNGKETGVTTNVNIKPKPIVLDCVVRLTLSDNRIIDIMSHDNINGTAAIFNSVQATVELIIDGQRFRKDQIISVEFGNQWNLTSIPNDFCRNFTMMTSLSEFPEMITGGVVNHFMNNCSSFNQPLIIPDGVTFLSVFMGGCISFNQPLVIPDTVTRLEQFLLSCTSFNQLLVIPDSVTIIDNGFMANCTSFNSSLTLSNNLTSIGNQFLAGASEFNQLLKIPNTVTSIGTNFMVNCNQLTQLHLDTNFGLAIQHHSAANRNTILSTTNNTVPMFVDGVRIYGLTIGQRQQISTIIPNRTTTPFRRLIS